MHHRHHNHRIKIVPFNLADNDKTIPNTLYRVIYIHKLPVLKNLEHLWGFLHNDIERPMCLIVCINVFVEICI